MSIDFHSLCAQPFSGDEKGLHDFQFSLGQQQASHLVGQSLVTELKHALGEPLHIPDAPEFDCSPDQDGTSDMEEYVTSGGSKLQQASLAQKCLSKPATSPSIKTSDLISSEEDDLDEAFDTALKDIFSEESNSSPLLSAMKGSREKSGAPPRKLTVKWAPDVYDPIPTIMSHTVVRGKKVQKSRKDKRNGKDKKKSGGNSSRGTNGKDKKQYRKTGGSAANRCYKSQQDTHDRVVNNFNDFENVGFDVDSYCGSSFLKKSPNKVHYSVAEAS